ncbi:hypothetical protein H6P81_011717 [Aristolochia fimbriata]|uniref:Uncharacterized protein n=1 Tax=Aristolochia fimbriata TaxID=158543 RepID=A0AAV7EAE7_ARIFI|nr:hypothetical protein H6P81_011717 [Aristolochia fimbriata]
MRSEELQSSNKKKLLGDTNEDTGKIDAENPNSKLVAIYDVCSQLFMILSCCFCCFCCGACDEEEIMLA